MEKVKRTKQEAALSTFPPGSTGKPAGAAQRQEMRRISGMGGRKGTGVNRIPSGADVVGEIGGDAATG
jgi:hypothetical protein